MKRPKAFTVMNFIMQRALFFIALIATWNQTFTNHLQIIASNTQEPLQQFMAIPFIGSVVMAALPMVVLLSSDVIIWQFCRCRRLQCLAFIPAAAVVLWLAGDSSLARYFFVAGVFAILAFVIFLFTFRNKHLQVSFHSRLLLTVTNLLPYFIIVGTIAALLTMSPSL